MARIVFAPLVSDVKGSIGGITFQKNPSGQIIRTRPRRKGASTSSQQIAHNNNQALLFLWQNLSNDYKDEWSTFAATYTKTNKFGEEKKLTGYNWFYSVNYFSLNLGFTYFPEPPPHDVPAALPDWSISVVDGLLYLTQNTDFDFDNNYIIAWCALPTLRNTNSINQIRKFMVLITENFGGPLDITAAWSAATGLDFSTLLYNPATNFFICLQSIRLSSNITSSLLCQHWHNSIS